jgi:diguanylate cyclase (GGDEF)-like protein
MNRTLILAGAGIVVCASYLAVIFGIAPETTVGPLVFASIAIPGVVTGFVMASYVIWETRNAREARSRTDELSTQLIRKEIEIGRLSTIDELTGLYTRREFGEMIRLEFERFRRHRRDASFLILEIDDIVELGDHVGQLGKGFLLAEVSAIIKHVLRTIDLGCRYTNESLAVLLPETDAAQARIVAGKVQAAVSKHEFLGQRSDGKLKLTVSQGIAVAGPNVKSHLDLMHAAEQALAEARASGYDQVRVTQARPAPAEDASATAA